MTRPRLRVGVIGLGVGEQHVLGFQGHPRCEVAVMCDQDKKKLKAMKMKFRDITATQEADAVLSDPTIDVVSIASYDNDHFPQVLKAFRAGKHVFVEKPLCQTPDELKALRREWQRHRGRLKLGCNLVLRTAPMYRWLRRKCREGFFGNIYAFDGDYLYGRLHKILRGWRGRIPDYSAMTGGGIHLIDLMLWITGQRPSSVQAAGNRICTRGSGFAYDDYISAALRSPSGLVSRITAHLGSVHRHQHVVRLFGTRATFIYDDAGARVYRSSDPKKRPFAVKLPSLPRSKKELIYPFVEAILKNRNLKDEVRTYFDAMSIALACKTALKTKKLVEVNYL